MGMANEAKSGNKIIAVSHGNFSTIIVSKNT
jgi:hypothetical protein